MNNKTARLINTYADISKLPRKKLKRQYNKTPRNKRFALKNEIRIKTLELK